MSGAEVIGLLASVSQLVQYATKLVSLLQQICQDSARSADRYQRHQLQVHQVVRIARLIDKNEGLKTELVLSHVESLTITTQTLQRAIEQSVWFTGPSNKFKKCLKVLELPKAQDAIVKGFADLEREKSCLSLCLLGEFGKIIFQIQTNLDSSLPSIRERVGSIQQSLQESSEIAEESRKVEKGSTDTSCEHCSVCTCQYKILKDTRPLHLIQLGASVVQGQAYILPYRPFLTSSESHTAPEDMTSDRGENGEEAPYCEASCGENDDGSTTLCDVYSSIHSPAAGRSYSRMVSFDHASQLNGNIGECTEYHTTSFRSWDNCQARESSNQINGDILDSRVVVNFFSPRR